MSDVNNSIPEAREKLLRSITQTCVSINKAPTALQSQPDNPVAQALLGGLIDTVGAAIAYVKAVWSNS